MSEPPTVPAKRVLIPIANGSCEYQTTSIATCLGRCGVEITLASITSDDNRLVKMLFCTMQAHITFKEALKQEWDAVVLPGGEDGAITMRDTKELIDMLKQRKTARKLSAACGYTPSIVFGSIPNFLEPGATCYPLIRLREAMPHATDHDVVLQDNIVTCQGIGSAVIFSLILGELLFGPKIPAQVARSMLVDRTGISGFRYYPPLANPLNRLRRRSNKNNTGESQANVANAQQNEGNVLEQAAGTGKPTTTPATSQLEEAANTNCVAKSAAKPSSPAWTSENGGSNTRQSVAVGAARQATAKPQQSSTHAKSPTPAAQATALSKRANKARKVPTKPTSTSTIRGRRKARTQVAEARGRESSAQVSAQAKPAPQTRGVPASRPGNNKQTQRVTKSTAMSSIFPTKERGTNARSSAANVQKHPVSEDRTLAAETASASTHAMAKAKLPPQKIKVRASEGVLTTATSDADSTTAETQPRRKEISFENEPQDPLPETEQTQLTPVSAPTQQQRRVARPPTAKPKQAMRSLDKTQLKTGIEVPSTEAKGNRQCRRGQATGQEKPLLESVQHPEGMDSTPSLQGIVQSSRSQQMRRTPPTVNPTAMQEKEQTKPSESEEQATKGRRTVNAATEMETGNGSGKSKRKRSDKKEQTQGNPKKKRKVFLAQHFYEAAARAADRADSIQVEKSVLTGFEKRIVSLVTTAVTGDLPKTNLTTEAEPAQGSTKPVLLIASEKRPPAPSGIMSAQSEVLARKEQTLPSATTLLGLFCSDIQAKTRAPSTRDKFVATHREEGRQEVTSPQKGRNRQAHPTTTISGSSVSGGPQENGPRSKGESIAHVHQKKRKKKHYITAPFATSKDDVGGGGRAEPSLPKALEEQVNTANYKPNDPQHNQSSSAKQAETVVANRPKPRRTIRFEARTHRSLRKKDSSQQSHSQDADGDDTMNRVQADKDARLNDGAASHNANSNRREATVAGEQHNENVSNESHHECNLWNSPGGIVDPRSAADSACAPAAARLSPHEEPTYNNNNNNNETAALASEAYRSNTREVRATDPNKRRHAIAKATEPVSGIEAAPFTLAQITQTETNTGSSETSAAQKEKNEPAKLAAPKRKSLVFDEEEAPADIFRN